MKRARRIAAAIAVVTATLCGGTARAAHSQTAYNRAIFGQPVVAVSDALDAVVDIYLQAAPHTRVAELAGFRRPQGLAYDRAGNLYVADTGAGRVFVFPFGATSPSRILGDFVKNPVDVAVGDDGTVYVANIESPIVSPGIAVFGPGDMLPRRLLSDPRLGNAFFVTVDKLGNVFTAYRTNGIAHVGEFAGGRPPLAVLPFALTFPGKLQMAGSTLVVLDQGAANVRAFHPPYRQAYRTLPLTAAGDPSGFDFSPAYEGIIVADVSNANVQTYKLSGGTLLDAFFNGGSTVGIATYPRPH